MKKLLKVIIIIVVAAAAAAGGIFTYLNVTGKTPEEAFPFLAKQEEALSEGEVLNRDIKNFTELDINSYQQLNAFEERYQALSPEEQQKVTHYGDLAQKWEQYREVFISEFDTMVQTAGSEVTLEEYDRLTYFKNYYKALSDTEKARIRSYPSLKDAIDSCSEIKRLEVIGRLDTLIENEKENKDEIASLLSRYCKLLHTEDIEKYVVYAVRSEALKKAESRTKDYIKKPKTYKRKKYEFRDYAFQVPDGTYEIQINIDYTYENNAGKTAKNSRIVYCYYKVNKKGVTFKHAELSKNDIWRIVHRGA